MKLESNKIGFLNDQEQKQYKSLTGKLLWAAEITRPDISFDVRELSTKNQNATYKDVRQANKTLERLKKEEVNIIFKPLGDYKDLKIKVYSDASSEIVMIRFEAKKEK